MHDAPRYDPLEASPVLTGGASAQPLVPGTVPRGRRGDDELMETGKVGGQASTVFPFAITRADLDRGQERFNIYCSPCHDRRGEGTGVVVQRGYSSRRRTTSIGCDRRRRDTSSTSSPTGSRRCRTTGRRSRSRTAGASSAYIRALQLSHNATTADVPADELQKLNAAGTAAAPAATPAPTGAPAGGR